MMICVLLLLSVATVQVTSFQHDIDNAPVQHTHRQVRHLGLGGLLKPVLGNQIVRSGPVCEAPGRQRGTCLPIDQCVLRELNEDYIKNKGYLCPLRPEGPVGVCCPDFIVRPVVYWEGMFGNKNLASGKAGETENIEAIEATSPQEEELI